MNVLKYRVSLDMFDTHSQITIKAKKCDSACQIHITLTENGKVYKINEGCYATFNAKKSDGNFIYDRCTIEGNTIVYDFASSIDEDGVCQVSAYEGIVECEITLYNADSNQLTSPRFTIFIDNTVYNGEEIVSSPEANALKKLIVDAHNTLDEIEEKLESGELSGECADVDQSYNPKSENAQSGVAVSGAVAEANEYTNTQIDRLGNTYATKEYVDDKVESSGGGGSIDLAPALRRKIELANPELTYKSGDVIIGSYIEFVDGVPNTNRIYDVILRCIKDGAKVTTPYVNLSTNFSEYWDEYYINPDVSLRAKYDMNFNDIRTTYATKEELEDKNFATKEELDQKQPVFARDTIVEENDFARLMLEKKNFEMLVNPGGKMSLGDIMSPIIIREGEVDFSGAKISGVASPTDDEHVATKKYVDNAVGNINTILDSLVEV